MNSDARVIGIDVGGTKIAGGSVGFPAGDVADREEVPTRPGRGGEAVLEDVADLVRRIAKAMEARGDRVMGVGVGVCELVDAEGLIRSSNSLDWRTERIREVLGFVPEVVAEADVRAAARAEAMFGAGRGLANFLYVTVGTGISCSLVLGGEPYTGFRGAAGTMGSSPLRIRCEGCGRVNDFSLEGLASGPALVERHAARTGRRFADGRALADAAEAGGATAAAVLGEGAEALGSYVALLINVLDPAAVILGGGLGLRTGLFRDHLLDAARRDVWSELHRDVPIIPAVTGTDAGLLGAAATLWARRK